MLLVQGSNICGVPQGVREEEGNEMEVEVDGMEGRGREGSERGGSGEGVRWMRREEEESEMDEEGGRGE